VVSKQQILAALSASALLLLLPAPAWADRIVTVSGGVVKGKIIKETRRAVHLRNKRGIVVQIPRTDIDRIEREDTGATFKKRLAELSDTDWKGLLKLARWAEDQALAEEATRCYRKVIDANPDQEDARHHLGYHKVGGRWLRGNALKRAQGLVFYKGRWVTPEDQARLEAGMVKQKDGTWRSKTVRASSSRRAAHSSGSAPEAKRIVLPEAEAGLLKIVRGTGPLDRKLEAIKALSAKGGDAREALRQELTASLAKAKKKLLEHFKRAKAKIRAKLARRIRKARAEALAVIFDKSKYPDANHGAVGQPLVDRLVGKLIQAYKDPLAELGGGDPVLGLKSKVTQWAGWLREYAGGDVQDGPLLAELGTAVAKTIDMQRFPIDAQDAKALRSSLGIVRYNKTARTSLTKQERACVAATNEYRMMFGLRALKVFEPLIRAARGHSRDMNQRKFFDHTSPMPGKRSPGDRCRNEGAHYTGENIAMGMMTGRGAFNAWYTSSGHHRNMLMKGHVSIGIGQDGK